MSKNIAEISQKDVYNLPFIDRPVEFYKLDNGHTIVTVNKPGELINLSTWVKTGSINEDDSITGISHFLEHLMFKGTPKYPAGQFDKILESKGAIVNAATWKDYTFYYVTMPKGENDENLNLLAELHADMMINPLLPEEEIGPAFDYKNTDSDVEEKRERFVVIEEIRMRDDNNWTTTYDEVNNLMYKVHPYKRDVIGTAEVIASVSRETINEYYQNWYTPENMITIIVGDLESEKALNTVREHFIFPEGRKTKQIEYMDEPEQKEARSIEKTKTGINTGFLILGFQGPKPSNLKENIAMDIVSMVLGEGKSSRFYQNLIEKQEEQIFNYVGATQYEFKDGNLVLAQANFIPDKKELALKLIQEEIYKLGNEKISCSELKKAKKKLKAGFAEESETVSEIGELIGHCMTIYGDICSHVNYLSELEKITKEDILDTAKKYLLPEKASISILVPEKE